MKSLVSWPLNASQFALTKVSVADPDSASPVEDEIDENEEEVSGLVFEADDGNMRS